MAAFRQQQQRPQNNMSSFVFLSILFFLLSNNNGNEDPTSEVATMDRLMTNLEHRELRRDGLALWLGLNVTSHNHTSPSTNTSAPTNTSTLLPIPFTPTPHANPALVPLLHTLLDPALHPAHYPQNLTGLGKGTWSPGDWTFERLGIPEAYNTTSEEPLPPSPADDASAKPNNVFVDAAAAPPADGGKAQGGKGSAAAVPEPIDPPFVRRAEAEVADEDTKPGLERVVVDAAPATVPIVYHNVTTTTNRTLNRGEFPWTKGGKLTLQLVEDQTSAVGAVQLPTGALEDGKLLGDITVYPKGGGDPITLDVEGVHFLSLGTFYAFATPTTLPTTYAFEVPGLPLFDDPPTSFSSLSATAAGHAILHEVDRRIARDKAELALNAGNLSPLISNPPINPFVSAAPSCTFTLYGRVVPLPTSYSPKLYAEYYLSLFHPTGSSLLPPPKTAVEYIMYSKPCGLVLDGKADLTPIPEAWSRATNLATMLGIIQGALLFLLSAMDSYTFIATFTVSVAYMGLGLAIAFAVLLIIIVWGWIALLIIVFYSYWIPQISLNVQRGAARMTLQREYIIGTTIGRLFLPVYFLACPNNLLGAEPTKWVIPLILYSTSQAAVLLLQDSRLGARFFLPNVVLARFGVTTDPVWEYHPLLSGLDIEGGKIEAEDCPICMEPIELGDKEDRELGLKGRARWAYMVPPCHHTCHTNCLESWMQIKNVCPLAFGGTRLPDAEDSGGWKCSNRKCHKSCINWKPVKCSICKVTEYCSIVSRDSQPEPAP
ncbi:hypothetical protein RQP46_000163 [Phenoliferia psychrophenolica]